VALDFERTCFYLYKAPRFSLCSARFTSEIIIFSSFHAYIFPFSLSLALPTRREATVVYMATNKKSLPSSSLSTQTAKGFQKISLSFVDQVFSPASFFFPLFFLWLSESIHCQEGKNVEKIHTI
jgi:hypothetical protein